MGEVQKDEGEVQKLYVTWDMFGRMLEELVQKVRGYAEGNGHPFDGIHGIPRGAGAIELRMSHALGDLPLIRNPTSRSLIVDDISDDGDALAGRLSKYEHRGERPRIACLFSTKWTRTAPDWYVAEKRKKSDWIVFPWERSIDEAAAEGMMYYDLERRQMREVETDQVH